MSIFKKKDNRLEERRRFHFSFFPKQEHRLYTQVKVANVYSRLDKATAPRKRSRSQGQRFYGEVKGEHFDISPLLNSSNHFTCRVQGTYEPCETRGGTELDLKITMCKLGRMLLLGWTLVCVALAVLFGVLGHQGMINGAGTVIGFIAICWLFCTIFMRMNFKRTATTAMDHVKSILSIKD